MGGIMKLLFLCTSEFQLLTALNIRCHMHPSDDADIIVDNYHGEEKELAERLRETNLFRKVFYVKSYIEHETLHAYFHAFTEGTCSPPFFHAIKNSLLFAKIRIAKLFMGARAYVEQMVDDSSALQLREYDAFFAFGTKPITCHLAEYFMQLNGHCQMNLLDEGIGTYVAHEIGRHSEVVNKCYAYAADLVSYEMEICEIPKLKKTDREFVEILNFVFQFRPFDIEDYRNSVIVFSENGSEVKMPKYLTISPLLSKTLFRNSYKRHLKEEEEFYERLRMMNLAIQVAGREKNCGTVWMKLNPRASRDQIVEYQGRRDIRLLRRWNLPWELLALNCPLENSVLLANTTSAVCMHDDVIDASDEPVQRILLWRLSKYRPSKKFDKFLAALEKKHGNLHVPKTMDELASIRFA